MNCIYRKPQPKAWTGSNPLLTTRTTNGTSSTEKPLPKLPTHTQPSSSQADVAPKHAHDRMLFLLGNCTGHDAKITLKSGEAFSGVFSGGSFDEGKGPQQYVLKMVKRSHDEQTANGSGPEDEYAGEGDHHAMAFELQDIAELAVNDVITSSATVPTQNGSPSFHTMPSATYNANISFHLTGGPVSSTAFRTDADIASSTLRSNGVSQQIERPLQRWIPGANTPDIDTSLEAPSSNAGGGAGWDQFAANERLYGVQSSYDENIYTTALPDRTDPGYKRREAEAARIAREIERNGASRAALAAETDERDEEDKYSGVRRDANGAANRAGEVPTALLKKREEGKYVPPSQRPITSTPTVKGVPYDPAIISTQKPTALTPTAAVASTQAVDSSQQAKMPEISVPAEETKPAAPRSEEVATDSAAAPLAQPVDHITATQNAFRAFASGERARIQQLSQMKRVSQHREKTVKLNDLKTFAKTFQLKSRVPDDLVPILAKDETKRRDIQERAEVAARGEEGRRKGSSPVKAEVKTPEVGADSKVQTPATESRSQFPPQHHTPVPMPGSARGSRLSQQPMPRGGPVPVPSVPMSHGNSQQGVSSAPRGPMSQRQQQYQQQTQPMFANRGGIQPLPADLRILSGPIPDRSPAAPLSPTSGARLNVNAFEFRPAASAFTPSLPKSPSVAASASPARQASNASVPAPPASPRKDRVYLKRKRNLDAKADVFECDVIGRLNASKPSAVEEHRKRIEENGNVAMPYSTAPTWDAASGPPAPKAANTVARESFKTAFARPQAPIPQQQFPVGPGGPQMMQQPHPMQAQHMMGSGHGTPHAQHGMPIMHPHMQGPPPGGPQQHLQQQQQQRPPFYAQHSTGPPPPGSFDPRMHGGHFGGGPNGSVQSSPRFGPAQIAGGYGMPSPFSNPGNQGQYQGMNVGMSPGMQYRQMQHGGGPQGMRGPSFGSSGANLPSAGGPPQQQQQPYGGGGGGQMMIPSYSNNSGHGAYPPPPPQQQQQGYSPMPTPTHMHAQMHHPYGSSPGRPGMMMQPGGSHQGFNPNPNPNHQQPPQQGGGPPPGMMGGAGGGPHPFHLQQRQLSGQQQHYQGGGGGGTPRAGHAQQVPVSPRGVVGMGGGGGGGGQGGGDEGGKGA